MARFGMTQVFILVAWVTVLIADVPHAVMGEPIRPVPLGHLTWILSAVVIGLLWKRRKTHPEDKTAGVRDRLRVFAPVLVGAVTAASVGLVGGTLRLDPWSLAVTTLFIVVPIGLGKPGLVAVAALSLTALGFYGGTIGRGTPAAPVPWWAQTANRYHPDYDPKNANLDPTVPAQRQMVLDYARSLFDTGAYDVRQQLPRDRIRTTIGSDGSMVHDTLPVGIDVLPQRDAWRIHSIVYVPPAIGSGRVGRVVAEVNVFDDSLGQAVAGLARGKYYVWIDNLEPVDGTGPATVRAVFVPTNPGRSPVVRRIPYRRHGEWKDVGPVPLARRFKQRIFPSSIAPQDRGTWLSPTPTGDAWVPCSMKAHCLLFEGDR